MGEGFIEGRVEGGSPTEESLLEIGESRASWVDCCRLNKFPIAWIVSKIVNERQSNTFEIIFGHPNSRYPSGL